MGQTEGQKVSPDSLLERAPVEDYIHEWTAILSKKQELEDVSDLQSVMVFRLGNEWLALGTIFFKEIAHLKYMHRIPHRSNKILQGVVNLNGELQLSISLRELLEIEPVLSNEHSSLSLLHQHQRMIAIVKEEDLWVFPVDEIDGIHLWHLSQLENVPVNISKSRANFLKGIMNENNRSIGLLDEELLFYHLNSMIKMHGV